MPSKRGIGDYIPARGEARVLAELKGSYGGRMRGRRSYGRSRYRGVPRRERYWFTNTQAEQGWEDLGNLSSDFLANFNIFSIGSVRDSSADPDDTNEQKLLKTEGKIWLRSFWDPDAGATDPNPDATTVGRDNSRFLCFWFWMVQQLDGTGGVPTAASMDFAPTNLAGSDLRRLLRHKNLLQWGTTLVHPDTSWQMYADGVGTVAPNRWGRPNDPPFSYIPMPRIPRMGIRLGYNRVVNLYASFTDLDLTRVYGASSQLRAQYYTGHTRWLLAK